ncbi:MAG TPA: condensation domain-containing protein, partial [Pseudonocardiaceae bacterium]
MNMLAPGGAVPNRAAVGLPLSFGQEQLWFLAQLSPSDVTYNVGNAFRLSGSLNVPVLRRSLTHLVERHDGLRATFDAVDGVPFQVIRPATEVDLLYTDLTDAGDEPDRAVQRVLADEAALPFDLESGPLYRFRLVRLTADDHVLIMSAHHIVTDGWSMGVLVQELAAAYGAFAEGHTPQLDDLPFGYAEHVRRQRAQDAAGAWEVELKYWQGQL